MDNKIKNIIACILLVSWLSSVPYVYARSNKSGYTTGAYSELDANETYLERMSDWFATIGKTDKEKAVIKFHRRTIRKINNAKKAITRKKKEIEKKKREMMKK